MDGLPVAAGFRLLSFAKMLLLVLADDMWLWLLDRNMAERSFRLREEIRKMGCDGERDRGGGDGENRISRLFRGGNGMNMKPTFYYSRGPLVNINGYSYVAFCC